MKRVILWLTTLTIMSSVAFAQQNPDLSVASDMYALGFGSAPKTCYDGTHDTKNNCIKKWLGANIKVINGATTPLDCSTLYPASMCLMYYSSIPYFMDLYWMRHGAPEGRYEDAILHYSQDTGSRMLQYIIGLDHFDYFERPHGLTEGTPSYVPSGAVNGAFLSNGGSSTDVTAPLYGVHVTKVAYNAGIFTITANNNFTAGQRVLIEDLISATFLNGRTVTVATAAANQFTVNLTCSTNCTGTTENGTAALTVSIPNGNTLYIGYMEPFDLMRVRLSTPAAGATVTYKYSKGGGVWGSLATATNWHDGTAGLTTGIAATQISFYPPTDWAPDVVNSSKSKFWVSISVSGATTAPVIYDVRGDNLISTYSNTAQCGTITNCFARGWSETAYEASSACGGSPCLVAGGYKYNPNPPANATARFRYQARATGYGGYPNEMWLNPSSVDSQGKTLVGSLLPYMWTVTKAARGLGANGSMFDNGGYQVVLMYPSWQPNVTDLACAPNCVESEGDSDFDNYWATAFAQTTNNLHSQYGSGFYVTSNTASNHHSTFGTLAPSLDQSWMEYAMNTYSPGNFTANAVDPQHSYDIGLAGPKVAINQTDSQQYSYCDTNYTPCIYHIINRGARGDMVALATHYFFGNANTLLSYSINSQSQQYNFTDQYYYFADATTLNAPITKGYYPTYSFSVTDTTNLVATTSESCTAPNCGGTDNPYAGKIIVRICPASTTCEDGDYFLVTTAPPHTVTISPQQGNSSSPLSGHYPYVAIGNSYIGNEKVQVMQYGHQALTLPANMPAWQSIYAYANVFPGAQVDIGVPDTVNGWQPPSGNCGYTTCNKGDRDLYYGTGCTTLHCSAQQWSGLPCSGGTYNSPEAGGQNRDCAPLARRDYTHAIVLLRTARTGGTLPTAPEEWETYSKPIDVSSFESRCAPYCTYYRLRPDGTTDAGASRFNLRGAESAILMKAPVTH
jgi:hypothetical protein